MKWRYSLRWKRPGPCPGEPELASEVVEAGKPAPESVMSLWVAGAGYAVCVDFLCDRQIRRWTDERKAATRRRNLARRVNRIAPLFADELIERELTARPEYFRGKVSTQSRSVTIGAKQRCHALVQRMRLTASLYTSERSLFPTEITKTTTFSSITWYTRR